MASGGTSPAQQGPQGGPGMGAGHGMGVGPNTNPFSPGYQGQTPQSMFGGFGAGGQGLQNYANPQFGNQAGSIFGQQMMQPGMPGQQGNQLAPMSGQAALQMLGNHLGPMFGQVTPQMAPPSGIAALAPQQPMRPPGI